MKKKNSHLRYVHFQIPPLKTNPNLGKLNPKPPRNDQHILTSPIIQQTGNDNTQAHQVCIIILI